MLNFIQNIICNKYKTGHKNSSLNVRTEQWVLCRSEQVADGHDEGPSVAVTVVPRARHPVLVVGVSEEKCVKTRPKYPILVCLGFNDVIMKSWMILKSVIN